MAHVQIAGEQHGLHGRSQIQQAQQIRHRTARTTNRLRRLFVRKTKLIEQTLDTLRFFERIEVFPLNVLNQRHRSGGLIGHIPDQHRHLIETSKPRCAETALTGDDLVFIRRDRSHKNRLHQALRANARREFLERTLIHARTRLILACLQLAEWQDVRRTLDLHRLGDVRAAAEQCLQPSTQSLLSCYSVHRASSICLGCMAARQIARTRSIISAPNCTYA